MTKKQRILLVDDEMDSILALKDVLEDKGFETELVDNGTKAVERAGQQEFDIILMDIKMTGMNGVEAYRKIKQRCRENGTAVIMMTAYSVKGLVEEAIMEGVYAVLRKPLDIDELLNTMRQAVEGAMILVVEDDADVSESIKDLLEVKGYMVTVAPSGEEAVEYAKRHTEDIILLDIGLPGMNGLETYLEIKKLNPNPITLMVTAFRGEVDDMVEKAIEEGVHTCLYKPLAPEKLLEIIADLAQKKRKGASHGPVDIQ